MADTIVTVDRVQVRRSSTPGFRPGQNGSRPLADGEEFVNFADGVRLSQDGGDTVEYPLRPGIEDVPGLPDALNAKADGDVVQELVGRLAPAELLLQPALFAVPALAQAAIDAFLSANAGSPTRLLFKPDTYTLRDTIKLTNRSNVTLVLDDTSIVVANPSSSAPNYFRWFEAEGGSNITIRGSGTIDIQNLPYTQGTIVAISGTDTFDIQIDAGFRTNFADSDAHFGFDALGLPDTGYWQQSPINPVSVVSPGVLRLSQRAGVTYAVGKRFVILHRKYATRLMTAFAVDGFRVLGDIRAYAAPGFACFVDGCRDVDLSGFRLVKKPGSGRLISGNADGIHVQSCRGKLYVRGTTVEYNLDDCFTAITSTYPITAAGGDSITFNAGVKTPRWQSGDSIEIFSAMGAPLGAVTLTSLSNSGGTYTATVSGAIPAGTDTTCNIASVDAFPSDCQVQHNTFGKCYGHGIIVSGKNQDIRDNNIYGTLWEAILIRSYYAYFAEGIPPRDPLVTKNRIDYCCRKPSLNGQYACIQVISLRKDGSGTSGTRDIKRPIIVDNDISNSPVGAICVWQAENPIVANNRTKNVCTAPTSTANHDGSQYQISFNNCTSPIIFGNTDQGGAGVIAGLQGVVIADAALGSNPGMTLLNISGAEVITTQNVANAANRFRAVSAIAGGRPVFSVEGTDTNITGEFRNKGSGAWFFTSYNGAVTDFRTIATQDGKNYVALASGVAGSPAVITTRGEGNAALLLSTVNGAGIVQTDRPFKVVSYTFSALPAANNYVGCIVRVSDRSNKLASSDGTNWRFMDGTVVT